MIEASMNLFFAVVGGYFLTSMFLLKNPNLIHRRKNLKFTCRHISHRGGAGEHYENTLAAFKRAVALGTDMLELDCQLTKDHKVVVSHDNNLTRSAGINLNICDVEYHNLPPLKATLPVDFDPGVYFSGSAPDDERRIPLLADVFKHFPTIPINIDIKSNNDILIKEVDRLITAFHREDITVWGSFSDEITYKCYLQNPKVNLLFSLRQVVNLLLLFYTGLLPFVPLKETHLEIFQPSMYLHPAWKEHLGKDSPYLAQWPTFIVNTIDTLLMRKSLFQHLEKRGIQTYIWVLNQESEFKKAFECGVTGVMTDYPTRLAKFLKDNPEYSAVPLFHH